MLAFCAMHATLHGACDIFARGMLAICTVHATCLVCLHCTVHATYLHGACYLYVACPVQIASKNRALAFGTGHATYLHGACDIPILKPKSMSHAACTFLSELFKPVEKSVQMRNFPFAFLTTTIGAAQ